MSTTESNAHSSSNTNELVEKLKQNFHGSTNSSQAQDQVQCQSTSTQTFSILSDYPILSNGEQETLRLIGQYLHSVGLTDTVQSLIAESGCVLEPEQVSDFRRLIMSGKWHESLDVLEQLKDYIEEIDGLQQMKYLILEQKYFELIEDDRLMDAILCLRHEIRPLNIRIDRTHHLTTFLMFNSTKDMRKAANFIGKGFDSREKLMERLQKYLPAHIMLPPKRLETLLSQAIELQQVRCKYHVKTTPLTLNDISLLKDHSCSKESVHCVTIQTLTDHTDEVWFCKFSPDGTKLATGSKDCLLLIYDVDNITYQMKLRKQFDGHTHGIGCIAWCPFSRFIIVCGTDDCNEIWIWDIEKNEQRARMHHALEDSLTCAAWFPCGRKFVCGGSRGQFYYCDIDGNFLQSWEGIRLQCLHVTQDGLILAADAQRRIVAYKFDQKSEEQLIREDQPIMSFNISKDGRLALLNIASQGVHLWDLQDKILLRKYQGVIQANYVNHGSFGGPNEEFLVSGSEDAKIYLWHRREEHPMMIFSGHQRTVNCVSWHPTLPMLFASASDDTTVRIWSTVEHKKETNTMSDSDD